MNRWRGMSRTAGPPWLPGRNEAPRNLPPSAPTGTSPHWRASWPMTLAHGSDQLSIGRRGEDDEDRDRGGAPRPVLRADRAVRQDGEDRQRVRAAAAAVLGREGDPRARAAVVRRSGKRYEVPVEYHEVDGEPVILTAAAWRANLRGGADVELVHEARRLPMRAELLGSPDEVASVYEAL